MEFISTIKLDKKKIDKYNILLDMPSEDDGVINAGYDEDSTIECFTAQFADGHFADIKICSGQNNFFCDPVLFNKDGYEVCVLDCADTLNGEYGFEDNGNDMYDDYETYDADTIYYVATKNYPILFNVVYRSMDELVSEFKNKLNKYFPDDFDYRKHICHIVGTYFC